MQKCATIISLETSLVLIDDIRWKFYYLFSYDETFANTYITENFSSDLTAKNIIII